MKRQGEKGRSPRVVEALARFGLWRDPGDTGESQRELPQSIQRVVDSKVPVCLITGPSGSGKSTALRAIKERLSSAGHAVLDANDFRIPRSVSLVDASEDPLELWLRTLARSGLGEARLLARTPEQLSVGEQHRLVLALAMSRAMQTPGTVLLIDEFVSSLDRGTAESVALSLTKWARRVFSRSGVRVIVASAHEELEHLCQPALVMRCEPLQSTPALELKGSVEPGPPQIQIESGTIADYEPLSKYHYLAGKPATIAGVWRAVRTVPGGAERLAGVLVVSYPTLNGRWRQEAWGARYVGKSSVEKRAAAKRLNQEIRCVSRVVVDPSSRGLGVARRLVEHYLANPLTTRTEAVAAMGAVSPFFARAGMKPWKLKSRSVDDRLRWVLREAGVDPAGMLAQEHDLLEQPEVRRGLRVWINATADARRSLSKGASEKDLLCDAACRLLSRPIAYTAERVEPG